MKILNPDNLEPGTAVTDLDLDILNLIKDLDYENEPFLCIHGKKEQTPAGQNAFKLFTTLRADNKGLDALFDCLLRDEATKDMLLKNVFTYLNEYKEENKKAFTVMRTLVLAEIL